jgi:hypothetical protein
MVCVTLLTPPPDLALLGLRALRTVGSSDGPLRPGVRRLMAAAQRLLLHLDADLDALAPLEPAELAGAFPEPLARQLVSAMVVASLVDGPPSPACGALVSRFAAALGVDEPAVETLSLFARGHLLLGSLDYHRRSNIKGMIQGEVERRGLLGAVKSLLGVRGLLEDPAVAAPFLALGDLPAGTLGRAFFDHYRRNGFPLPGEKGGFPESGVYHDFTHVLTGYGTDPASELQVGAFTAGLRRQDPLYVAMLPLLVFCADINVTPIPHEHPVALFSQPGVAERYLAAFQRGAQVTCDLSDHWDFWPLVALPLEEARARLGIEAGGVADLAA